MVELTLRPENRQAQYFTESLANSVGLDMIVIPGGQFEMGSPEDEPERYDDERPQHLVNVSDFCMGRYPVTQAQWRFVAGLTPVKQELNPDPSNFKGDTLPVEQVSWYDAVEFCQRLSAYTKRAYRLPSEAEWEYACRAGTKTPFYFGSIITPEVVNYDGTKTYNNSPEGEYREKTTPVDHFEFANAWGLSDMHGNVWEWCQDHWHSNYEGAPTDGSAWLSDDEDTARVIRGGSWGSIPRNCRSATRDYYNPRGTNDLLGFRVVCSFPRALP
ncbi:MAG: formylglycine-generating enzyme family protein [Oculatellaceae cyanobacterium bins.114]|nr:formylglycine-generating enzyme family protein [Oculatellaceae cyanobacterium bins.114]